MTTAYNVSSEGATFGNTDTTTLNGAIRTIDTAGSGAYVINITGPISLSSQLLALNLPSGVTLTIEGTNSAGTAAQVQTIDGASTYNGFFVYSGDVTIENLTLANMKAQGGAGGNNAGGGAGLGGGLFVAGSGDPGQATTPHVTLNNVVFNHDAAVGGNGGNGGPEGGGGGLDGGVGAQGGGGIGLTASGGGLFPPTNGGGGIVPGAASGGRGAGNGGAGGASGGGGGLGVVVGGSGGGGIGGGNGGSLGGGGGGFGGGGGGGGGATPGGAGGFGGGGGFGGITGGNGGFGAGGASAGAGGFGGGAGGTFNFITSNGGGGGGGLGAGGDIFVQQGGVLTIEGGTLLGGGVTGGNAAALGDGGNAGNAGNGSAFGSGIFLQGNGTLTFAPASARTESISDVITDQTGSGGTGANAGSWSLLLNGAGTLTLAASDTYSGGTTISSGTLQLGNGGAAGAITGNITDNAALAIDRSDVFVFGNAVSGAGTLAQIGTGTTVVTAAESNAGGTTVLAGTLELGAGGALKNGGDVAIGGGTLDLGTKTQTAGAFTLVGGTLQNGTLDSTSFGVQAGTAAAVLGGSGALTKTGSGTVILSAADTYSGGTTISAGTLQLGNGGTAGSITGSVTDDGVLAIDRSDTVTWSTAIAGNGGFAQIGAGVTIFTAAEGYKGGTTVDAGTLQLGTGGSLVSTGPLTINGGTFDLGTANQTTGIFTLAGGTIQNGLLNSATFDVQSGTVNAGLIGNGGLTKEGGGTVILSGSDSYTGGTTIDAGTLQLGSADALPSGGNVAVLGGTLDLNGFSQTVGDLSGSGFVTLDAGILTAGTSTAAIAFSGAISGSGAFVKQGAGTLTFTGANGYNGGTTITAGTLRLGSAGSLADGGDLTITGGTFDLNGHSETVGDLSGAGGFVTLGSGVLTAGTANSESFAGVISGSGAFIKAGSGTLVLTGNNIYSGSTFIQAGTLQLGNGGTAGAIVGHVLDNGVLALDRSDTVALSGTISGNGAFEQVGSGITMLTAANAYTGGTMIDAGTLELGSGGSITGNVTFADAGNAETLRFDTGANQLGGSIAGFAINDDIDLGFLTFNSALSAVWQENGANTGGTLSLMENGSAVATLNLSGQYVSANFSLAGDGHGGTVIGFQNAPAPAGTSADMIMSQASTNNYQIYDLGNNAVLAVFPLTNIPSPWQVVGLGGFNGSDTSDMMLRNTSTGAFEIVDVSNNNASAPVPLGNLGVGLDWAVAGFGDFSGRPGETDMLLRDSSNGNFELYDFGNNAVTSTTELGNVGLNWTVAGFGDLSDNPNETDMLMRDSNTGNFELYDFSNNTVTSATALGNVGLNWQVAGFGDFSGNPNETDMLMRDSNNGNFELYDFSHNSVTSATALGNVGLEWQVDGIAPYQSHGAADAASNLGGSPSNSSQAVSLTAAANAAPAAQLSGPLFAAGEAVPILVANLFQHA